MRQVVATDNFNRADSPDIGANWTPYDGYSGLQLANNVVQPAAKNVICAEAWTGNALNNDQYIEAKVTALDGVNGVDWIVLLLRGAEPATARSFYALLIRPTGGNTQIYKITNGSFASLGFVSDPGWQIGDLASFEAVGTTLTAYRNGSTIGLSITDGTFTSGRAGLMASVPESASSTGNAQWDDAELGNIVPDPPAAPSDLVASNVTHNSADLDWTDNATDEDEYQIMYRVASESWPGSPQITGLAANTESHQLTGLSPETDYEVRARAVNENGASNWSNVEEFTTLAAPAGGGGPNRLAITLGLGL